MSREHSEDQLQLPETPYELLGGRAPVEALAYRFYSEMDAHEPTLAKLHPLDEDGRVERGARDRFALFLVGWLGGPQEYTAQHGHPRLRMRHARVAVNLEMRDAWLRAMKRAMDAQAIAGPVREYLDVRFAEVAEFMRNTAG